MGRLVGKHALITGGTSGIGLETARQFLAEGAKVAITGRSQDGLDQAKKDLGGDILTIKNDAGVLNDQEKLAAELARIWPKIDILMCNAADTGQLALENWTPEQFDAIIATNLKGPLFLIKALTPLFSRQSSIILIGSISSLLGHLHSAVYGASKAALVSLARGLSYEFKDRGIRVNAISPGPIITNNFKELPAEVREALYAEFANAVPIKRNGRAIEIAKAAVYLASDESAFTVAQVLRVDGGIGLVATA
jgi:NAD(P)-dependent dehydrogenase (short-subunit alcohol dehydrogenase family)